MLALDASGQRTAVPRAGMESEAAGSGEAARRAGGGSQISSKPEGASAEIRDPGIPGICESINYLIEKEGEVIRRLRVIAAELGLALMLCDEKGHSFVIAKPAEKLACGGIPPRALQRVRDYIGRNLDKSIDLDDLARVTGLSRCHFARAFKQSVGTTPHYYLMQKRVEYASKLLRETDIPLAQIALECGFSDQSHLSRRFRMVFKRTPRAFRRYHR